MNKLFWKENERYVYGSRSLESHKEKLMPLCEAQKRSRQIHSIQVEKHKQRQNSKSSVSTIFTRIVRQVALFILPFSLLAISHILFFPIYFNFSHPTKTILSTFFFLHFIHSFLARIPTSPLPPSPDGYFPFCPFKLRTKKMVSSFHHTLRALFLFVFRFFLCCSSSLWIFIKQKISNLIAVQNQNRWLICSFHKKKSF